MSARGPTITFALALLTATALAATADAQILEGPPDVTIDTPADGSTVRGVVNVTGNASDAGLDGSVEKVEVKIDNGTWREANGTEPFHLAWDTRLWESGNHTVTVRATDDDGNEENETVEVTVDQAPKVRIVHPREGLTLAGDARIQGIAEDPEGDLEAVEVRIDDGPWTEANGTSDWVFGWNTTNVTDGEHTITVRADDGGPTSNRTDVVNVTVSNEKENPPSVVIDEPDRGQTVTGVVQIEGIAHDPEGNLTGVAVRIDQGPWKTAQGRENWSYRWDTSAFSDGEHTITARAHDRGETAHHNITVTVDNGNQTPVEIEQPVAGADVEGTVTVAGTVDEGNASVQNIEVSIDGGPWTAANGTSNWTFEWDTSPYEAGPHRIAVRAQTDQGPTAPASVTVNLTSKLSPTQDAGQAPELALEAHEDGERVRGELTLAGAVHDSDSRSVAVEYRIDGGTWNEIDVSAGERFEESVDVSDLEPGEHTVTVRASDGEQTSEEESFTIHVEEEGLLGAPGPGPFALVALVAASLVAIRRRPAS